MGEGGRFKKKRVLKYPVLKSFPCRPVKCKQDGPQSTSDSDPLSEGCPECTDR